MKPIRIEEIRLDGFKGVTRTTALDRLNLFVGHNGSGKTAHLLGPTFAITGGTSLGRTLDDSCQLADNGNCAVGLRLNDGFEFERSITKDHRSGSVSSAIDVRGRKSIGLKDAHAMIGDHCGRFAPMFDVAEFLALSPDKRRAFLLDLCARRAGGSGAVDAKDLTMRAALAFLSSGDELGPGTVETFVTERFGVHPDSIHTVETRAQIVETLLKEKMAPDRADALRSLLRTVEAEIRGEMSEAIGAAIEHVRQAENHAKSEQDRGRQAASELSARKAAVQLVAGDIEEMKAARTALETERESIVQRIGQAEGRETADKSLRESIERLDREIASAQAAVRQLEAEALPPLEDADRLDGEASGVAVDGSRLDELNRRRTLLLCENPSNLAITALEAERNIALDAETKAAREIASHEGYLAVHRREAESLQRDLESARVGPWRRAKALMGDLIDRVESSTAALEPVLELARHIDAHAATEADPDRIVSDIAEKHRLLSNEETALAGARTTHKAAIETRLAVESKLTAARADLATRAERHSVELRENSEAISAEQARVDAAKIQPEGLRAKAREIRERHQARERGIKDALASIGAKQAERTTRQSELDGLRAKAGGNSLASLKSERERLDVAITDCKGKIEAKERYALLEREYTQCVANAEKRGIVHEIAKGLGQAIKTLRESLMAELIDPAKTLIDRFIGAARPGVESYCLLENARGTAIFELGWIQDGRPVALPALSGGERCIFVAALGYALTMLADPPLKLLLLEASEIDLANLTSLMAACEAVANDLGNVLIATHVDNVEAATGWNIVRCGESATNGQPVAAGLEAAAR